MLSNIGVLIGNGACNASCSHCSGIPHRGPNVLDDPDRVRRFVKNYRANSLSISGAGEPFLFPHDITKLLLIVDELDVKFEKIKVYTNGIIIGSEPRTSTRLWFWQQLGLTHVYLTTHAINDQENAKLFGVATCPPVGKVIKRIRSNGLSTRINLVLMKGRVDTAEKLEKFTSRAVELGADEICCWLRRGKDDKTIAEINPEEMERMKELSSRYPLCVYWPPRECKDKICLFPDGTIRDTWCK